MFLGFNLFLVWVLVFSGRQGKLVRKRANVGRLDRKKHQGKVRNECGVLLGISQIPAPLRTSLPHHTTPLGLTHEEPLSTGAGLALFASTDERGVIESRRALPALIRRAWILP